MRIVLADDIEQHLNDLKSKLSSIGTYNIICFTSPLACFEHLSNNQADLLFLDIDMPDLTGFKLLRALHNPPKVVFVSSYPEYAVESFDFQPLYFIKKPAKIEKLLKAVSLAEDKKVKSNDFFFVREDGKNVKLSYDQITHIASDKDYVRIYKTDGSFSMVLSTLRNILKQLPAERFLRINKTEAINIKKLEAYNNNDVVVSGKEMAIGLTYREAVLKVLVSKGVLIVRQK